MDKLKVLLVGSCSDEQACIALRAKLKALQASKAGPFDAAFVVGKVHPNIISEATDIPIYLQDDSLLPEKEIRELIEKSKKENEEKVKDEIEETLSGYENLAKLGDGMFLLRNTENMTEGGVWSLQLKLGKPPLVVVACPPRLIVKEGSPLVNQLSHVSYTGCDLLLSSEGPQGLEQYGIEGSYDIAAVALPARARYHAAASSDGKFVQSPAFSHLKATTSTASIQHSGRVLTLGQVVPGKVDKANKYIHALGLVPLHYGKPDPLPPNLLPNPFTDESYEQDGGNGSVNTSLGLSNASARRILQEESGKRDTHRWVQKRERDDAPPDPDATTLFLHGIHRDVTGNLQGAKGDDLILEKLSKWGASQIRRPPGGTFCFADFGSHKDASACHSELGGSLTVGGVDLDVKWASRRETGSNKKMRITEKEAQDSSTVRFKITNGGSSDNAAIGEELRALMERTLEKALAGDDDEIVKAADEPALQVKCRVPEGADSYGFLEFASHAAASMALATVTGSTDGGLALPDNLPPKCQLDGGLYLNWAKAASDDNVILDDSGFTFTRQHFPADSRKDCWFCLASDSCEKHLITGVYKHCYAAMPKGAVHDAHLLLVPVQHSSKGVWQDRGGAADEMEEVKKSLRQYVKEMYGCELFVFERAIQTKGGYHTHVQCVPVPSGIGIKLQTTMLAQARRSGMELSEINSDLGLQSLVGSDEDNEGYFYAEIPVSSIDYKRFVYQHTGSNMVPLQFGREILAAALHKPNLAHWKSCVVDRDQETDLASKIRAGFKLENNE